MEKEMNMFKMGLILGGILGVLGLAAALAGCSGSNGTSIGDGGVDAFFGSSSSSKVGLHSSGFSSDELLCHLP